LIATEFGVIFLFSKINLIHNQLLINFLSKRMTASAKPELTNLHLKKFDFTLGFS